ncbi:Auxin response factor 17 [Forsythia ovata]|uniref:Auxin response factor n=1 Tax=Forsythia ovata TaxID=205694 RepID=A0ABD1PWD4_9LAMI
MSIRASEVDPVVWKAIAGSSVEIPPLNSPVYYFPQGHLENSSSTPIENYNLSLKRPFILCQLLAVRFLADPSSDQVFAEMRLQQLHPSWLRPRNGDNGSEQNDLFSYAKILTPSDAKNEGGFSVPRYCADLIFQGLDLSIESPTPFQNLVIKDIFNFAWEFRHVYRGTPRRHLLTTGWKRFINSKQLVAGDCVVLMRKKSTNELFIGIRRAYLAKNTERWNFPVAALGYPENRKERETKALSAIEAAAKGMAFDVEYYPRAGTKDFVVSAEKVEDSLSIFRNSNMRIKMAVETQDFSRKFCYQGCVTAAISPDGGTWAASPWRMLQVTWDQSEIMQNMNRVSPWEVEYDMPNPQLRPSKKLKVQQNSGTYICDSRSRLKTKSSNSPVGHLDLSSSNQSRFPASIQGARLDQNDSYHQVFIDPVKIVVQLEPRTVSTAVNNGNSHSENLSPGSQNSVHFCFGTELVGQQGYNSSKKDVVKSFQLFGSTIQMADPVERGLDNNNARRE